MSTITDNHYFESLAKELDSKVGRINSLVNNHPGEKGNYHEYVLKDFIMKFLPKRYSVKTGFIYVDDKHISPQIDLMIIDENKTPNFIAQYDDFVVVYPEAVCCVIEVKTFLNKKEFKASTDLIQKVKELSIYNNPAGEVIGAMIFSFNSEDLTPQKLDGWYKTKQDCSLEEYPDAILSFRKGFLIKWNIAQKNGGHYFVLGDDDSIKWKSLSILNGILIKYCELRAGVKSPPNKNPFVRFSRIQDLKLARQYLRFKTGLIST